MKNRELVIEERCFKCSHGVVVKDYGDEFDPLWGFNTIEFTKEDIEALLEGKILETNCNYEYGVLIRMERAALDESTRTDD